MRPLRHTILPLALIGASMEVWATLPDRPMSLPVVAAPIVSYSPETSWAFGAAGAGYFSIPTDSLGRTSEIGFDGTWSLERQWYINIASTLYLTSDWQLRLRFGYQHYPNTYYGLGNTDHFAEITPMGDTLALPYSYTGKRAYALAEAYYRVHGNWFIGGSFDFRYDAQGIYNKWLMPAVGAITMYDSRDRIYYPTEGLYFRTMVQCMPLLSGEILEQRNAAFHWQADLRQYITLYRQLILAYQVYADIVYPGSRWVAPELLPSLGGPDILRGFRNGRYRDQVAFCAQTELRFPIYSILKGAAFVGIGDTYNLQDWHWAVPKVGYGLGLRLCFHKAGLNIRADVARNNIDHSWSTLSAYSFYLTIKEAF